MPWNLEKEQKYNKKISFAYGTFLLLDSFFNLNWRGPLEKCELSVGWGRGTFVLLLYGVFLYFTWRETFR
jgi:hypothetical protein